MLTVWLPTPRPVKMPVMLADTPKLGLSEVTTVARATPLETATLSTLNSKLAPLAPVPQDATAKRPLNVISSTEPAALLVKLPISPTLVQVLAATLTTDGALTMIDRVPSKL